MKKALKKIEQKIYYVVDGVTWNEAPHDVRGDLTGVWGDLTDVRGDLTGVWGDLSGVWGDLTGVEGDLTPVRGNLSGVWGDLTGVKGDITGVWGDLDDREVPDPPAEPGEVGEHTVPIRSVDRRGDSAGTRGRGVGTSCNRGEGTV